MKSAQSPLTIYYTRVPTTRGDVFIMASEKGICWAGTPGTPLAEGKRWVKKIVKEPEFIEDGSYPVLKKAVLELNDYLKGKRLEFSGPFDLHGTAFQIAVWKEMIKIHHGNTKSYAQVATAIGSPRAVRAVGGACGANPVAVLVPCHRVVGTNGKLTGYGGGLPTKKWLLAVENGKI